MLAGGRGTRLGGVHKPALVVGGRTLLDRVLAAVAGAAPVVVVGPDQPVPPGTVLTREDPPGGGPVAALAAGLGLVPSGFTAVLAADLPFLSTAAVDALRAACVSDKDSDGAILVDAGGRDQYLAGVWRVDALRCALASFGDPSGGAMRRLVGGLAVARVSVPGGSGAPDPWFDCDDPGDLDEAKRWT